MKRVKILSASDPALIGKEALYMICQNGVIWLNGNKIKDNRLRCQIIERASEEDCTFIAYQEMSDNFYVVAFCNLAKYYAMANHPDLMDGTITKRLRDLRAKGKVNYEVDRKNCAYRKLPLPERTFQEQIRFDNPRMI
jgi:hypothetical protein